MIEHPVFPGLRFRDDDELGALLGSAVAERRVVHEWPLTRTEEVRLSDGRHVAYKCQLPPSIEPGFYASARSPLLPAHVDLGRDGECSYLVTDWIESESLHAQRLSRDDLLSAASDVVDAISRIDGDPPTYLDLSTRKSWDEANDDVVSKLRTLIGMGRFGAIPLADVDRLRRWAGEPGVIAAATARPTMVHGDLSLEEVFRVHDGWRVIDWQRPVLGPRELDLVSLLRHARIDPAPFVAREFVELSSFLLLHWSVTASHDLLPDLPPELPQSWAVTSIREILALQGE